jgi:hypothetical protein
MLYLLGGIPRAGKSIIARKMLWETKTPYFSLDYLMMGLANGVPQLGVDPFAPLNTTGEKLWPLVKEMCVSIINIGVDYVIEGAQLLPRLVNELLLLYPSGVKACFIGYAGISPHQKLTDIRNYRGLPNDWANVYSDEEILAGIHILIHESKILGVECARLNIPYFDSSTGFNETMELVIDYFKA